MITKELREKRANLNKQATGILDKAEEEKRELTTEEGNQFDALHVEIKQLKTKIERIEQQEETDKELRESQGIITAKLQSNEPQGPEGLTPEQEGRERVVAFRSWLVNGISGLTSEQREIMARRQSTLPLEARAMSAGIDTAGGYTVFDEFVAMIETALKDYSGIRNTRATILKTNSGNQINLPTSNDTNNSGSLVGENIDVGNASDISLGSKALHAYMFTSKPLRVSLQFLQDTDIANVEQWIADRLAERIARGLSPYFISGTGNNQPENRTKNGHKNNYYSCKNSQFAFLNVFHFSICFNYTVNIRRIFHICNTLDSF
jgi:HK97 family phage major capsid protein